MAKFMEIRSNNPKLKQSEIAKLLELSSFTIQRYGTEVNMLSPYRIPPSSKNNHARKQKTPNTNFDDVKVTSNDLKMTSRRPQTHQLKTKKNKLKGGANIEINEKYLDEIMHNN